MALIASSSITVFSAANLCLVFVSMVIFGGSCVYYHIFKKIEMYTCYFVDEGIRHGLITSSENR